MRTLQACVQVRALENFVGLLRAENENALNFEPPLESE